MNLTIRRFVPSSADGLACTQAISSKIIDTMLTMAHGVIRMVPDLANQVDTSVSFSLAELKNGLEPCVYPEGCTSNDAFMGHWFGRSSSEYQTNELVQRLDSYIRLSGAEASPRYGDYPGWAPNLKSPSLQTIIDVHKQLFNKDPRVYSVHAGLECGLIMGRYPNLDCVSIGPTIVDAHSPDERLRIPSVEPGYQWLRESLIQLARRK